MGRLLLAAGGLALAVIAVGWVLAHGPARTQHPVGAPAAAARSPVTHPRDPARALKPLSAVSFDPYGDGLGENSQLAHLAIDGNPATAWHTQWYASASFGDLKPGTGLLLDMGRTVTISTVRVLLGTTPGADFQLRAGATASSLTGLHPVAHASDAWRPSVPEPHQPSARPLRAHLVHPAAARRVLRHLPGRCLQHQD